MQAGWEYLIETGTIEELNEAQLRDYFVKHGLENVPSTKLEMVMDIKRHNAEVKRRVYRFPDVAQKHWPHIDMPVEKLVICVSVESTRRYH